MMLMWRKTLLESSSKLLSRNVKNHNVIQQYRKFHASKRREIVPIIIAVVGAVGIRYTYRAIVQMEEDWQDYEDALEEYNRKNNINNNNGTSTTKNKHIIGIDLGSVNLRVSHSTPKNTAEIIINSNGARSTPNVFLLEDNNKISFGNFAHEKILEQPNRVFQPFLLLQNDSDELLKLQQTSSTTSLEYILPTMLNNIVEDAKNQLSLVDEVHPIVTYPPMDSYEKEYKDILSKWGVTNYTVIPEPIAAIEAARHYNLVPSTDEPILLMDMGGKTMTVSIVAGSDILYSRSYPDVMNGDVILQKIIHLCTEGQNNYTSDAMAMQRIYNAANSAVLELSNQKRVDINIPYISMDIKTQTPKHLQVGIGQLVLEQSILQETSIRSKMVQVLTDCLTESNLNPFQLSTILAHGGSCASPITQKVITTSLSQLAGDAFVQERLVLPKLNDNTTLFQELVVLGASLYGQKNK